MAQIVKLRRSSVSGQKPTNTNLQLGELALNTTDGKVFMAVSGSGGPSVQELVVTNTVNTGSINLVGAISASVISGSFIGNASGLTNVPFSISGSDVDGNTYNKTFTKLQFDDDTGLNVSESAPGTAFISIGSHFRDIFVSGSGMLRATGSDAFEITSDGGLVVTVQNTDTNYNGYTKELNFSVANLSSSLNTRMNEITGSLNSFTSSVNQHIIEIDNFTSSVVLTNQTSSMTVLSASYAVTAAFALNAGGGGSSLGSYSILDQTTPATTWSFQHNAGQRYPIFQVFDTNGNVIIPTQIKTIDENNAQIIFGSAQSGKVIASLGSGNGTTQEFTNSNLWTVDHNLGTDYPDVTVWDNNKTIIIPNKIESITENQIKIYFSVPVTGHVSVSRGGHLVSGSVDWSGLSGKPSGIVSSSNQLTGAYDSRYVLSGSITQTTWDNIANKPTGIVSGSSQVIYSGITGIPSGIISGSIQVDITNTTNYTTFSSSIDSSISSSIAALSASIAATDLSDDSRLDALELSSGSIRTDFNTFTSSANNRFNAIESTTGSFNSYTSSTNTRLSAIESTTGSLNVFTSSTTTKLTSLETESGSIRNDFNSYTSSNNSRVNSIESSTSSLNTFTSSANGRLNSLETESGSIRTDFNTFTSSYTTVSGSLDSRLDVLEAYSSSQQVPTSSFSFRTVQTDVYCKNLSGAQINKGQVVRIVDALGDNPLIALADYSSETNSANSLGIATENIPNDSFGLIITEGILVGVNTLGMTAGQLVYLGTSGSFTTTKPIAPNHGVRLGEVLRVNQNVGSIYVRIDNGMELDEAHDVNYNNITQGDLLVRNGNSVWVNTKSLSGSYALTGSLEISGSQNVKGNSTVSGSLTVLNNLTVFGSSSFIYVTSSQLAVSSSTISVNVFEPAERFGGLKVYDSGSSNATASLLWDSQHNHWVYQNVSGAAYSGAMLITGPRNTGSLGDEPNLTLYKVPVSDGGDHIKDSTITDNGTKVSINNNTEITGSLIVTNGIDGVLSFTNISNLPTLVSSSTQINITGTTGYSTFSSSVSTSIGELSSSVAATDLSQNNRLNSLENKTGSYATTGSNQFNGNQSISGSLNIETSISASYIHLASTSSQVMLENTSAGTEYHISAGNGGNLNIHENNSNKIIGLFNTSSVIFYTNLYATGTTSGSFVGDGGGLYNIPASGVTGLQLDKIANGSATASISQADGLVVNTNTTITGSVNITGSLYLNGVVVGTGKLDSTEFYTYTSSINPRLSAIETSTGSLNTFSSSAKSRLDSLETKSSSLTVICQTLTDNTGSYATTGSNSFIGNENINGNLSVTGSVIISGSLDISNANVGSSRYLHTQASTNATWSITHNLGYNYPNVTVYDGATNKIMLPADVVSINQNTTQVTFATPEYGYALVSVGGVTTATADRYLHTVSSATGSWVINHNFNYKYVNIDVYDNNDEQLIPQKVTAVSANTVQVDFATPTSGNAIITVGGPRTTSLFTQTGSFYNTNNNIGITGSLVVTGDVDATNFNTTSDKKLKTNLERIEGALDKIDQINGYTFNWLQSYNEDDSRQIGLLADEVYEVQPELISKRNIILDGKDDEIKLLDYSKVTALLIEAVKELNDKVKKLENKRKKK